MAHHLRVGEYPSVNRNLIAPDPRNAGCQVTAMSGGLVAPGQRPVCKQCLRPQKTCICQWITPTAHQAEVVVLQHPLEEHQAKGTARLLHLSLAHSALVVGETFDDATLHACICGPLPGSPAALPPPHTLLLYPDTPHNPPPSAATTTPPPTDRRDPTRLRLIVLDGTWRKSRKMLYCNPSLQQLPRFALRDVPASNYHIRQAHHAHQLSTLEATCAALATLEGDTAPFAPLLAAFDGFVAQQGGYREIKGV